MVAGVVLIGAAAAVGWGLMAHRPSGAPNAAASTVATTTAAVTRSDVAERSPVNGTLGHSGAYTLIASGSGTITRVPAVSHVIKRGRTAYEIDGRKVVLLYGSRPVWRAFQLGMTDGSDVHQLETNLAALGYGGSTTVDRHFSIATYWAIRDWQGDVHLPVTGTVPLGQIVFTPSSVRISADDVTAGAQVHPGQAVAHGTSDRRAVTVQLSPADTPSVRVGDDARVSLPDGSSRTGTVTRISSIASSPDSGGNGAGGGSGGGNGGSGNGGQDESTVPATVTIDGAVRGYLDQAQVQVEITTAEHKNVLTVPVVALHAVPGGMYEVVVVDGVARRHVRVRTGLFDETAGVVEVSGQGLSEGARVEVPRDSS